MDADFGDRYAQDHDGNYEDAERTVTECVDVYLLAPEDDRAVELKDFTIMKPKNNKMHRLVRYYPRCEISYRAVPPPPPEEKVVTSPNGTNTTTITTTTHRHNGGFSNPSRNAEVFRMKRKLLKEYYASIKKDPSFGSRNDDEMLHEARGGSAFGGGDRSHNSNAAAAAVRSTYRRPASPPGWDDDDGDDGALPLSPLSPPRARYPRYRRAAYLPDEDTLPLTSQIHQHHRPLSYKARVNYISSLWPEIAPVDDDEEIMEYYGLEVTIISEETRKQELQEAAAAAAAARGEGAVDEEDKANGTESKSETVTAAATLSPIKQEPAQDNISGENEDQDEENEDDGDDTDSASEGLAVETRSAAKLKDSEPKISPIATKQDDWVQCDKCAKWRRLPNHVNVSELPASWYCKMNRWDKRFNKCTIPEEKVVVPMKETDLVAFRERKFTLEFVQRIKRMEKAIAQFKFSDPREDTGARHVVQCVQCFKQRPLIGGMDPRKVAQPFVCWMNSWDEMHASCSAPQGAIPSREYDGLVGSSTTGGTTSMTSTAAGNTSGAASAAGAGASGAPAGGKKASSSRSTATGSSSGNTTATTTKSATTASSSSSSSSKRRPSDSTSTTAATSSQGATANTSKKAKRR